MARNQDKPNKKPTFIPDVSAMVAGATAAAKPKKPNAVKGSKYDPTLKKKPRDSFTELGVVTNIDPVAQITGGAVKTPPPQIGTVISNTGDVWIQRGGKERQVKGKFPVTYGDRIVSRGKGEAEIIWTDVFDSVTGTNQRTRISGEYDITPETVGRIKFAVDSAAAAPPKQKPKQSWMTKINVPPVVERVSEKIEPFVTPSPSWWTSPVLAPIAAITKTPSPGSALTGGKYHPEATLLNQAVESLDVFAAPLRRIYETQKYQIENPFDVIGSLKTLLKPIVKEKRGFREALESGKAFKEFESPVEPLLTGEEKPTWWNVPILVGLEIFAPDPSDLVKLRKVITPLRELAGLTNEPVLIEKTAKLLDGIDAGSIDTKILQEVVDESGFLMRMQSGKTPEQWKSAARIHKATRSILDDVEKATKAAPPVEPPRAAQVPTTKPVELRHYTGNNIEYPTTPDAHGSIWFTEGESYLKSPPKKSGEYGYVKITADKNKILDMNDKNNLDAYLKSSFGRMGRSKTDELKYAKSLGYDGYKAGNDIALTPEAVEKYAKAQVPTTPEAPVAPVPLAKAVGKAIEEAVPTPGRIVDIDAEIAAAKFEEPTPLTKAPEPEPVATKDTGLTKDYIDKRSLREYAYDWVSGSGKAVSEFFSKEGLSPLKIRIPQSKEEFVHDFISRWVYIKTAAKKYGADTNIGQMLYETKKLISDARKRHLTSLTGGMPKLLLDKNGRAILDEVGRPRIIDPIEHGLDRSYSIQSVLAPMDSLKKNELYGLNYKGERAHLIEIVDDLLYAKHAQTVLARGRNPGTTVEAAIARINAVNGLTDNQKAAVHDVYARAQHASGYVREYLYKMGVIDQATKVKWETESPFYIPLNRLWDEALSDDPARAISKALGAGPQAKMLKMLYGSEKGVISPLRSIFDNAILGGMYADKMVFQRNVVDFFSQTGVVEKVQLTEALPGLERKVSGYLDNSQIETMITETGLTKDEILDITTGDAYKMFRRPANFDPETMLWVMRDGKKELWKFSDKMLLDSVRNDDPLIFNYVIKLWNGLAKTWKMSVTATIDFMMGNLIKDAGNRVVIYDATGNVKGLLPKGMASLKNVTDALAAPVTIPARQLYAATARGSESDFGRFLTALNWAGYSGSSFFDDFQRSMPRYIQKYGRIPKFERVSVRAASAVKDIFNPLTYFDQINKVGWMLDQPQRISVALDTYRKTRDIYKAALMAREVSTDFAEMGKTMRLISGMVPFSSASIGGLRTAVKLAKQNPVGFFMRGMITYAVPSILMELRHKDDEWYQDLSKQLKGQYFILGRQVDENGQEFIYMLPKPWEIGAIFSSLPQIVMRESINGKPVNTEQLMQELWTLTEMAIPKFQNPLATTLSNIKRNYDPFLDKNIENKWDVMLGVKKSLRDAPDTPEFVRGLTAEGTPLNRLNISPEQLDYSMRRLTGYWGKYGRQGLENYQLKKEGVEPIPKIPEFLQTGNELADLVIQMATSKILRQTNAIPSEPVSDFWDFVVDGHGARASETKIRKGVEDRQEAEGLTYDQATAILKTEMAPHQRTADTAYFFEDYIDPKAIGVMSFMREANDDYKQAKTKTGKAADKSIKERIEMQNMAKKDSTKISKIILDEYREYMMNPKEYEIKHPPDDKNAYFNYIQGKLLL